jgi:UDP-N-acetylmuramoyl-tripeptide--D-alanyl-D-alanine ligase
MRRQWRKLGQLATPLDRHNLWLSVRNRATPQLQVLAALHRRTLARRVRIVTVVGSFGKTTTAAAVCAVLGLPPPPSNRNADGSVALRLLRLRPWQRHAVFEVALSGPGQMAAIAAMVRPDLVVVTSIGSEHNRSFGNLDVTRAEKGRMVEALGAGGTAVLNRDDLRVMAMAEATRGRVVTCGFDPAADVRATDVELDFPHGTRLTVHVAGRALPVRLRLLGRVMVYPCLAALAVAWIEGLPLERAVAALEALPPRPGRLQLLPLPGGAWLLRDDYKSQVETIDAALDVLAEVPGRRIVVIGSISEPPGSQYPIYRRLGERLAQVASRVVVVSPMFRRYAVGATAAGMPRAALVDARGGVRAAWEAVRAELRPGDVVLVKGRITERLDRVALALQGRDVRCAIESCKLNEMRCEDCPKLATGWASS